MPNACLVGSPVSEQLMHIQALALIDNHNKMPNFNVVLAGDPSSEQFMHIEALDYHDRPKFTMRWR